MPLIITGVCVIMIRNLLCICVQQEEGVKSLGTEGLFLFSSLDADHDLFLSPEEFKPIAEKLTGLSLFISTLLFLCLFSSLGLCLLINAKHNPSLVMYSFVDL